MNAPALSPPVERVLVAIHDHPGSDVNELVDHTGLTRGQVIQAVMILDSLSFIERRA